MGSLTLTPIGKVSVGGEKQAFLCTAAWASGYATSGDTIVLGAGLALNRVTEIVGLRGQVGTDNLQGIFSVVPATGLVKGYLNTTGAEVTAARTITPYSDDVCLVFGK